MRQIILDTETTGLSPKEGHRIIEIGCLEMINRRLTGSHFHQYINPQREIDAGAQSVHGITNQFLADKPLFSDVADAFIRYVDGAELVIHNAPFDVGFLDHEIKLVGGYKKIKDYCDVLDTLVMARQLHPGQKNNLDALCKRYNVRNSHRELHGALLDAEILAYVYLAMTGGQVSMFAESVSHSTGQVQAVAVTKVTRGADIPVLMANETELIAHANFMSLMKENT